MAKTIIFPDIIVILVVYAGIFYEIKNVFIIALVSGFFRGIFSPETLSVDIVVFPAVGALSYAVGKLFNRNNPAGGILITFLGLLFIIGTHVLALSAVNSNNISVSLVVVKNWRTVILSVFTYPLIFLLLNIFLKRKKTLSDTGRIF